MPRTSLKMSMMKWLIISTVISLPFMFIMPSNQDISGLSSQAGLNISDLNVSSSDMDPQALLAQSLFDNACGSAILQGCPLSAFQAVYSECQQAFGNLTLEQCAEQCCNSNSTAP